MLDSESSQDSDSLSLRFWNDRRHGGVKARLWGLDKGVVI